MAARRPGHAAHRRIKAAKYDATAWRDYFVMVGGGAAALTAVFLRCGLILMGNQGRHAVALEIIGVLVVVEVVLYRSLADAIRTRDPGVLIRGVGSFACLVLEQLGAVALFVGASWGLYVVALGMLSSFVFIVTGAWLLLVGLEVAQAQETPAQ